MSEGNNIFRCLSWLSVALGNHGKGVRYDNPVGYMDKQSVRVCFLEIRCTRFVGYDTNCYSYDNIYRGKLSRYVCKSLYRPFRDSIWGRQRTIGEEIGGIRRQIAIYVEDLENFRQIRTGNAKDLEQFADLLDIAIINLKETNQHHELGNDSLYTKLQRKLPQSLLANYHRWVFENNVPESVAT